ncbi:hypothetical protein R5R35_008086 [Gryllus longicercus]|uniref:rRNA biogenesis protein RRP36 n=1 Tax=Gryllus longicercus TaxID=2509291 RepID=A0AAN9VKG7_9ORTH
MEDDDPERLLIREKISGMSFEELVNLKKELGGQAYNEAIFGIKKKPCVQKRLNKNRPTEISSKIRPRALAKILSSSSSTSSSAPEARDPRFDHLCGEFDEKRFKTDYSFISDIKAREKGILKKKLKREKDSAKREKLLYLINRIENQERAEHKLNEERKKKNQELEEHIQMLREGKKPRFVNKSEKRVLDLVEQYEDLKKKGKVEKVIEKYRKKNKRKDAKKMNFV